METEVRNIENFYVIQSNGYKGIVDNDGNVLYECILDDVNFEGFSESFVPIKFKNQWGFYNPRNDDMIRPFYDEVRPFHNGFASICLDGKWGAINRKGSVEIQPMYLQPFHFDDDFAIVYQGEEKENCKLINKRGYEMVSGCLSIARCGTNQYIFKRNVSGEEVTSLKQFFTKGKYVIVLDSIEKDSVVDFTGKFISDYSPEVLR